jgi:quinol-cytochrome oxidoreductase complex cytochrome b subunit
MKRLHILVLLAQLALIYNTVLLLSVTLNLDWAKPRAAGGEFDSFPIALRIIYLGMAIGMIFLMRFLWRHRENSLSQPGLRAARLLGYLFALSTLTQLISRSPEERFNAIPALIISLAFFSLLRRDKALEK